MNRVYLDALRRADEEMAKQEATIAQLTRQVRDLTASQSYWQSLAEKHAAAKEDKVLGVRPSVFLTEMEIIRRGTGKGLRTAFALWQQHRDACAVTEGKAAVGNASREGLRAWMGEWAMEGFAERMDHLCDCGDTDCPTDEMEYVEGRGFVNRWTLADERFRAEEAEKAAAQAKMLDRLRVVLEQAATGAAAAMAADQPKKPLSWADRVRQGPSSAKKGTQ